MFVCFHLLNIFSSLLFPTLSFFSGFHLGKLALEILAQTKGCQISGFQPKRFWKAIPDSPARLLNVRWHLLYLPYPLHEIECVLLACRSITSMLAAGILKQCDWL